MSLRSPLGRVLNHGSAHDGVSHWWAQRVSAIALVPLTLWLLISLLLLPSSAYAPVTAWIAAGWNPVLLSLTVALAAWHSYLGVQVVIEDYVHGFLLKTATLLCSTFAHVLVAVVGVYAVLHLALRGAP